MSHSMPGDLAERELSICRVIDAPRERLFKAWTDPELVKQWWAPPGVETPVCEIDARPGGVFHTVMRMSDGTEFPSTFVYLEVAEPERIVFTDAYVKAWVPAPEPSMTVTVTLEDCGGKTKYIARARHWTAASRQSHEERGFYEGASECLDQLVDLVTRS